MHTYDIASGKLVATIDMTALTLFSSDVNFGDVVDLALTDAYLAAFVYPYAAFFDISDVNKKVGGTKFIPLDLFSSRYSGLSLNGMNGSFSVLAEPSNGDVAEVCAMNYNGDTITPIGSCVTIGTSENDVMRSSTGTNMFLSGIANNTVVRFALTQVAGHGLTVAEMEIPHYSHDLAVIHLGSDVFAMCYTQSNTTSYTNNLSVVSPSGNSISVTASAVHSVPVGTQVLTPNLAPLNTTHFYEYYMSVNDASVYEQLWALV
eukprot:TRINITY_DN784_c2_g1_i3.p1 TRINITY_DN784_c2_g1~~TRINITY_DN784_c2_g1_i3.p1  ORF type:complete len:261 (+),score=39.87 TRINITY_DN784_c2_g1_i3:137-919(+)